MVAGLFKVSDDREFVSDRFICEAGASILICYPFQCSPCLLTNSQI